MVVRVGWWAVVSMGLSHASSTCFLPHHDGMTAGRFGSTALRKPG